VAFGGEVEDGVRRVFVEGCAQEFRVADVAADEGVALVFRQVGERGRVSGVGERVEVDDVVSRGESEPDEVGADEAAASCDE